YQPLSPWLPLSHPRREASEWPSGSPNQPPWPRPSDPPPLVNRPSLSRPRERLPSLMNRPSSSRSRPPLDPRWSSSDVNRPCSSRSRIFEYLLLIPYSLRLGLLLKETERRRGASITRAP